MCLADLKCSVGISQHYYRQAQGAILSRAVSSPWKLRWNFRDRGVGSGVEGAMDKGGYLDWATPPSLVIP